MLSLEDRLALLESISSMLLQELTPLAPSQTSLTAGEIRRLRLQERQHLLAKAAQLAIVNYQPGG